MAVPGDNPWLNADVPRGAAYDERFVHLAAQGHDVHGEAALMASLDVGTVLDAGCGTGRVAVELARQGLDVVGVDADPAMLAVARERAPLISWVEADLVDVDLGRTFEAVVMAGNVMIFLTPGTESAVVTNMVRHLSPGGLLVAGFSCHGPFDAAAYDGIALGAGLSVAQRWSTWDRRRWSTGSDYVVFVHRRP